MQINGSEVVEKGEEMTAATHIPVALERCIEILSPAINTSAKPVIVDATLGLGGHSYELLNRFPNLQIIAIDRDQEALKVAKNKLKNFGSRISFNHAIYSEISEILQKNKVDKIDGALFDLGVSSMQLDQDERGFSYSRKAPLDMRMDQSQKLTAQYIIENYEKGALIRVLKEYGEEKFANKIAGKIIENRGKIFSTLDLAQLVKAAIPAPARRTGGNPAKRTFQALRIEVNGELRAIEVAVPAALEALNVGGRLVVMSYQSLEDKIIKRTFETATKSATPLGLPIELPGSKAKFKLLTRGSEASTATEIETNSRAQSMRLRAIERLVA